MLNVNCIVCTETFISTDEIFVTRCGHLFHKTCICPWLQRSETCPQCRNICTNAHIHKVYCNNDSSSNMDNRMADRNLKKADLEIGYLLNVQSDLSDQISEYKELLEEKRVTILSYADEVKRLKKELNTWKNDTLALRSDLEREKILRTEIDAQLCELRHELLQEQCQFQKSDEENHFLRTALGTVKMTPSHLKWLAHERARSVGWRFVWVGRDGLLLARKQAGSPAIHIGNAADLCYMS